MILEGIVEGMRAVSALYEADHPKAGQRWSFLAMEIQDAIVGGELCSCQLRHDDSQFKEYVDVGDGKSEPKLLKDLKGHRVSVVVVKSSAGERGLRQRVFSSGTNGTSAPAGASTAKAAGAVAVKEKNIVFDDGSQVPVVRFQITDIQDMGLVKTGLRYGQK
jgi:hypothetical protein